MTSPTTESTELTYEQIRAGVIAAHKATELRIIELVNARTELNDKIKALRLEEKDQRRARKAFDPDFS